MLSSRTSTKGDRRSPFVLGDQSMARVAETFSRKVSTLGVALGKNGSVIDDDQVSYL